MSRAAAEPSTVRADRYFSFYNDHILELLPEGAKRFLDVGCSSGNLGAAIKEKVPGAVVEGLELEPQAIAIASKRIDKVHVANLDDGIPESLAGPFDCIVCGDILEHLIDPWTALSQLSELLSESGHVMASIPNVRFYKVVRSLVLKGRFTYRETGIMDSTHLRFFTLHEMRRLFDQAGLEITTVKPRLHGGNLLIRSLDALCFGGLEEFRAAQYTLVGKRK